MDNTKKSPTLLSLCTGYGGIEKGIENAIGPIQTIAHVEIEAFADTNMVNKMETWKLVPVPIWTDLKTFHAYAFRDKVDILTGGYPCQPFSAAGKRKGKEDPRHLWPWIREIIKAVRPGLCFFENVEGHISLGLREVLTDLVKLGYSVENDCGEPTWGLFSAAEVGAPHQRKRVFIMAYSERSIDRIKKWDKAIRPNSERPTSGNSGPSELLANSGSSESNRIPEPEEREQNGTVGESGIELGNSKSDNERGQSITTMHREGVKVRGSGCELADTISERLQESGPARIRKLPSEKIKRMDDRPEQQSNRMWPARPGQPQHECEEPRTVADTQLSGAPSNRSNVRMGREKEQSSQGPRGTQIEIKSKLGRTIDGNKDRVDRLRLCGNGVVPATAEKAFITLMNRILNPGPVQPSIQLNLFQEGS